MVTIKFNNVFVDASAVVGAIKEQSGVVGQYLDKCYDSIYAGEKTYEKAEKQMIKDLLSLLKEKGGEADIVVGGDLSNQISSSNLALANNHTSFIGIYSACATSAMAVTVASIMIESGVVNSALSFASSHYGLCERQFRYFVEYGIQRRDTYTYTATGAGGVILKKKGDIKVTSATIGSVVDWHFKDSDDLGCAMAPAALATIKEHLKNNNIGSDYYDLIVTGDLSKYGLELLKTLAVKDNINVTNINDCGLILYQGVKGTYAGGSGAACSALVTFGYLFAQLRARKIRKLLLVATGALMSPVDVGQKMSIPVVAHAVSFEVVE